MRRTLALSLILFAAACGDGYDRSENAREPAGEHADAHVHTAPRGGALVVLAEETAHVEVLLDADSGRLSCYVLGPHAEKPVRVAQETLDVVLTVAGVETTVTLPAVGSELTGETVGDTSEFSANVDVLKGVQGFQGEIARISARGTAYENVSFTYP